MNGGTSPLRARITISVPNTALAVHCTPSSSARERISSRANSTISSWRAEAALPIATSAGPSANVFATGLRRRYPASVSAASIECAVALFSSSRRASSDRLYSSSGCSARKSSSATMRSTAGAGRAISRSGRRISQVRHRVRELRADTAVDDERLTRDVRGQVGRQEQDRGGDVGRQRDPPQRRVAARCGRGPRPRGSPTRAASTRRPGATALTRTFDGPSSTAPLRTSDISPALAAPYAECRGADVMPDTDATKTMTPPPLAASARPPSCMARYA